MNLSIGAFLLLFIILSTGLIPSPASGECGWILWERTDKYQAYSQPERRETAYLLIDGFPSYELCTKEREKKWEKVKSLMDIDPIETKKEDVSRLIEPYRSIWRGISKGGVVKVTEKTFYCLPETFDPRR